MLPYHNLAIIIYRKTEFSEGDVEFVQPKTENRYILHCKINAKNLHRHFFARSATAFVSRHFVLQKVTTLAISLLVAWLSLLSLLNRFTNQTSAMLWENLIWKIKPILIPLNKNI